MDRIDLAQDKGTSECCYEPSGSIKCGGISWIDENVLASQEGLWSMEFGVSSFVRMYRRFRSKCCIWMFRLQCATSHRRHHFHSYDCDNLRYCFVRLYIKWTNHLLHSIACTVELLCLPPTVHCCSADTSRIISSYLRWDGKMEVAFRSVYFIIWMWPFL